MIGIFWRYNALNFSISFMVFTTSSSKASHLAFFYHNYSFIISCIFFASSNSTFSSANSSSGFLPFFSNYINNCFLFSLLKIESVNLS
jgi:hypothetical protein